MKTIKVSKTGIQYIIRSNPSLFGLMFKDYVNGNVVFTDPSEWAIKKATEDMVLFQERQKAIYDRKTISDGDYVLLKDGTYSRVTVAGWPEDVQIGGLYGGSFYIGKNGYCSYSGGCGESIKKSELHDTGEYKEGSCWLFSGDSSGAHRGVYHPLFFKVWKHITQ